MPRNSDITLVPTSSMNFEKQVRILRAYIVLSEMGTKPIHYKKVVTITRLARTQVSGVNAFFVGLGFLNLVGKGTYVPTKDVVEFYSDTPGEEDYSALTTLVSYSALFEHVKGFIQIHGQATKEELISYLLDESGETTSSRAERSLQWLEKPGLIRTLEDGTVIVTQ